MRKGFDENRSGEANCFSIFYRGCNQSNPSSVREGKIMGNAVIYKKISEILKLQLILDFEHHIPWLHRIGRRTEK